MRVEATLEDVDPARVSFFLCGKCSAGHRVQKSQEEDAAVDGGQDGDEVEERHVVDQINSALDDILVEGLDRKDGEDIFSFLEGSQEESK